MPLALYTLASDPWQSGMRPAYHNGRRWGMSGHSSGTPCYPDHETAIRAILNGTYPMPDTAHHRPLSVAEVIDLRVSAKATTYDPGASSSLAIGFNTQSGRYELRLGHGAGPSLASHADIAVIGALVRGERYEPGFIRKVLDPAYVPDELALDADAREAARRKRAAQDAQTRARAQEEAQAAAAQRRLTPASEVPDDLSADDLFRTL